MQRRPDENDFRDDLFLLHEIKLKLGKKWIFNTADETISGRHILLPLQKVEKTIICLSIHPAGTHVEGLQDEVPPGGEVHGGLEEDADLGDLSRGRRVQLQCRHGIDCCCPSGHLDSNRWQFSGMGSLGLFLHNHERKIYSQVKASTKIFDALMQR